jgi:prevent-host-death family protein
VRRPEWAGIQLPSQDENNRRFNQSDRRPLATPDRFGHLGPMKKTSLAHAKTQLSTLVSEAQHKRRSVIILRHGKPCAAIVPIDVALAASRSRGPGAKGLTHQEVRRLFGALGKRTTRRSAVADLLATRR